MRGSREISLVPSLHRASTDALIYGWGYEWCRHLLVSFLFHAPTSLHPLHFIEMIFPLVIRASVEALCRDGTSEISRDPPTKRLQTRRENLARPSEHTNNNF